MKQFDPTGYDFDHPSWHFRLEDRLKALLGEPLFYGPLFDRQGGFQGREKVLDFGCGGGVSTRCIARRLKSGGSVTGVDVSSHFVRMAERRIREFPNARVVRSDIRELALDPGTFDIVSVIHVLHDIAPADRLSTFQALVRLLGQDGRLWLLEFTRPGHGMPVEEIRELASKSSLVEGEAEEKRSTFRAVYRRA